uniref:Conotoxin n=1 Tax=Conus praecellens TaxID=128530 RepID=A0A291C2K2_CONPC|nr:conotoxin [Conus praecellens]
MKLTCVLIVAVLFLTACQLITTDDSSDLREFPRRKKIDRMLHTKAVEAKDCRPPGNFCNTEGCCDKCIIFWCVSL